VKPGAIEECNGRDDDCDGQVDEEGALGCRDYYYDGDGDGYGKSSQSKCLCKAEAPYSSLQTTPDCDDNDPSVHPGAQERCNGKDDDCDGATDEQGATGCTIFYLDSDRDGYGLGTNYICSCEPVGVFDATRPGDCSDTDKNVYPGAQEHCNNKDDDCNGVIDDENAIGCSVYYRDGDGDGFGSSDSKCLCAPTGKYTADISGDCNDVDKNVYPGAVEVCNGKDDNCDGVIDEENAQGCTTKYRDKDKDGYGDESDFKCLCRSQGEYTANQGGDCDDNDREVRPGAQERCGQKDYDCDGLTDEENALGCTVWFYDYDWDGFGTTDFKCLCTGPFMLYRAPVGGDCNDNSAQINPNAQERCNGVDDNCNGYVDEEGALGCVFYYLDADRDGYGTASSKKCLCSQAPPYDTMIATDCDDQDPSTHPGAPELCNNQKDDDCDGKSDDEEVGGCENCINFYEDKDGDGYGIGSPQCLSGPSGNMRATRAGDCDDNDAQINPGVIERCNGKDDNCNSQTDEENALDCTRYYLDEDNDGYGTSDYKCLCQPSGKYRAQLSGDCNDASVFVNPGAVEACNNRDDDCDGLTDEEGATGCTDYFADRDQDGFGGSEKKCLCGSSPPFNVRTSGDCDDTNPNIKPGASEECNGKDDDCDGMTDEEGALGCTPHYRDQDGDGVGVLSDFKCLCTGTGQYTAQTPGDCDDLDPLVRPGNPERCNNKDDDCDGLTDEEGATNCVLYYFDGDRDGYGSNTVQPKCLCAPSAPYLATVQGDCADSNANINPGAIETCNFLDDDCDGQTDEEGATGCSNYYYDNDGDGFGLSLDFKCLCSASGKYTAKASGDCNDNDKKINPNATETCNGTDDDCDAAVDEEGAVGCTIYYRDNDLDGFGQSGEFKCLCAPSSPYIVTLSGDCDDANRAINPASQEACDGLDNNCNGKTDEQDAVGCIPYFKDIDRDGYGSTEYRCLCAPVAPYTSLLSSDCNDALASVHPDAPETCNFLDDDCDGVTDNEGASGCKTYYFDNDNDGYGDASNFKCLCRTSGKYTTTVPGDCDDGDRTVNPGRPETCNGKDDDCDGLTDEDGAQGCKIYYKDADQDGFGVTSDARCLCSPTPPYTSQAGGDCNDNNPSAYPTAVEVCGNRIDENCNGLTDELGCVGCINYFRDDDLDGFGISSDYRCLSAPEGSYRATRAGDCNDNDGTINPGAQETCNQKDDDCDGQTDEDGAVGCVVLYYDADMDGFGITSDSGCFCNRRPPYTATSGGDCDDGNASVYPGRQEVCDGKDNDCDGITDNDNAQGCTVFFKDADRDGYGVSGDFRCICSPQGLYSATVGGDCDDTSKDIKPGGVEICGNQKDDNCNGSTDEEGCQGCTQYYKDRDGDGYGVQDDKRCLSSPQGEYRALVAGDCNDLDPEMNPGQTETCDGKDNNCDARTDEEGAVGCTVFFYDLDQDGFGKTDDSKCLCSQRAPYTARVASDCDDTNRGINPSATERCNGIDDNCDGVTDDEGALGCIDYYFDGDDDNFGITESRRCLCNPVGGHKALQGGDCDDKNALINPMANERCNFKDDDCNGVVDDEGALGCSVFYRDDDKDGYGVSSSFKCLCAASEPYTATQGGDCDDTDRYSAPNQRERCDGKDNDCDGATDEGEPVGCTVYFLDNDRDGWGVATSYICRCEPSAPYDATKAGDCNDSNAHVSPGTVESCNGLDDDCDGVTDEEGATGCVTYFRDIDGDGFGSNVHKCLCAPWQKFTVLVSGDCDDSNSHIYPGATEICNRLDDNCNGVTDEEGSFGCITYYKDEDNDGYGVLHDSKCLCSASGYYKASSPGDCNDHDSSISPGAQEECNGRDDNCNGQTDESGTTTCTVYFKDYDNDGFGGLESKCLCAPEGLFRALVGGDCNDQSAQISPNTQEICNGVDDNCNGWTDEEGALLCTTYYKDADHDGYGDASDSHCLCQPVGLYTAQVGTDCDDTRPNLNPGAVEVCGNQIDDNCNGETDEAGCSGCIDYYKDVDNDGYGIEQDKMCLSAPLGEYRATRPNDCDDQDGTVNPGAQEKCNNKDDNCNGVTDEEGASDCTPYFYDEDGDGYGYGSSRCLCAPTGKYTALQSQDCNDGNPQVHPNATELCNSIDDNCNGLTDEENAQGCLLFYMDNDNDGYGQDISKCLCAGTPPYTATRAGDCDDYRAGQFPGAPEECNGRDDDCDGATDEADAIGCTTYYRDSDGDGFGVYTDFKCLCKKEGQYTSTEPSDCNDGDASVYPGAPERCNGKDDNCNGTTDEQGSVNCTTYFFDADGDGFGTSSIPPRCLCAPEGYYRAVVSGDCMDTSKDINPNAQETCNYIDDNCNGVIDEEGATGCSTYYKDADKDGYGRPNDYKCLCVPTGEYTATRNDDCDDSERMVNPSATEQCDGKDNDCDGITDEQGALNCAYYYRDEDMDGFGANEARCLCAPQAPYTATSAGDCDDSDRNIAPTKPEVCNGKDDDCDGLTDEEGALSCTQYFKDLDGDGFGSNEARCLCSPQAPWTALQSSDCNDNLASINPSATEQCNGMDDNCDGVIDNEGAQGCVNYYLDNDQDGYGQAGNFKCLCAPSGKYTATNANDCNDQDAQIKPSQQEQCNNVDDNCDGIVDNESASGCTWFYKDQDGDGFGLSSDKKCLCRAQGAYTAQAGGDCDDSNSLVSPAAPERCNGKDDNCDSVTDGENSQGCTVYYKDEDGDGYGVTQDSRCLCQAQSPYTAQRSGDCNDASASINPGAIEACNGIDDNCDGLTDPPSSNGCQIYYLDQDQDGFGTSADQKCLCGPQGGYSTRNSGDCNDGDRFINPGQAEVCDGRDNNCDGITDPENTQGCTWFYKDSDNDGYGVLTDKKCLCAPSAPYVATRADDCDDTKPSVHKDATEVCSNNIDDDCDGQTDEAGCSGCTTFYKDQDGDGFGVDNDTQCLSGPQGVYRATRGGDCNDNDASINPGAQEACNSKDDNCNGQTDEENASGCVVYYKDEDSDSYGVSNLSKCLCAPSGLFRATRGGDCNDSEPLISPGASERCDGIDNNCNNLTDEEGAQGCVIRFKDQDLDTYGVTSDSKCLCSSQGNYSASVGGDCNDTNALVNPGVVEVCGNQIDDNCNGQTDEEGCGGCTDFYYDADNDSYGVTNMKRCLSAPDGNYRATRAGDCDDSNASVNPGAQETCNGKDDDCDGQTDEEGASGCTTYYQDMDGDNYGRTNVSKCLCAPSQPFSALSGGDCNDSDSQIYPGATERCNGIDDNCDGVVDNEGAIGCHNYYKDADGDGYGLVNDYKCLCQATGNYRTQSSGDCDDTNPQIKPGATEICNGKDDNCDGITDPENSQNCQSFYYDYDGDGFGTSSSKCLCSASGFYRASVSGDCNDSNAQIYPNAPEICNSLDDDCDGSVDEAGAQGCTIYYYDGDNDQFGATGNFRCLCASDGVYTRTVGGDCNDADPAIRPGAPERCNNVDDDCDGATDEANPQDMCGSTPNGNPSCVSGVCVPICNSGYYDVNGNYQDGCECRQDDYDNSGNSGQTAIDLGSLPDSPGGSSITINGRIVPDTDVDWYKFEAKDLLDTGTFDAPGADRFHVRIKITSPTDGSIKVNVYRGTYNDQITCSSGSFNSTYTEWFTDFSNATQKIGQAPCVWPLSPPLWECCKPDECQPGGGISDACCGGINNNNSTQCSDSLKNKRHCEDDTRTFYVKVYRASGHATSCLQTDYTLVISNATQQ
jgi:hypothetical protein